ncbi:MAG: DCC1-like thiol-disulfide oxidoreductase family protein [Pontimonas sp.]
MARQRLAGTVLVYDGDCAFCALWVGRLERALPAFPHAMTSAEVDTDDLGLDDADLRDYVWLITPTHHMAGAAAFSGLLRGQKQWSLRFLGHLLNTWPLSLLADIGYRLIARFRHRLPGSSPSCEIPRNGSNTA